MSFPQNKIYFDYLQSFRGFAVINVVLLHATVIFYFGSDNDCRMHSTIPLVNDVLFHGSTMYFTIISGILFSAVFKQQGYKRFYSNKFFYLIIPYIFFSTGLTFLNNSYYQPVDVDVTGFFSMLPIDLLCGKSNFVLWYIPIFIMLCILTPLIDFLLHKNTLTKVVFFLFILAPLYFSRIRIVDTNYIRYETLIYFIGPYAIGMYWGLNPEGTLQWIKKNIFLVISIALLTTAILFYVKYNQLSLPGNTIVAESFFYIQKIALAAILILFFRKLGDKQPAWLRFAAKDSMPVYFIHGFVLAMLAPLLYFLFGWQNIFPFNILAATVILTVATFIICKSFIYLLRKLLGSKAKMFLGSA